MSQEKWPASLVQLMQAYPTEAAAEQWFVKARWPKKITCPSCDSDNVNAKVSHPTMPYRCRACRRHFSVKTGTVMQSSNLSYMKWLLALYLLISNPKGISALQLSKHLEVDYKTAWHLSHRIREAWNDRADSFDGTTEIDETGLGPNP